MHFQAKKTVILLIKTEELWSVVEHQLETVDDHSHELRDIISNQQPMLDSRSLRQSIEAVLSSSDAFSTRYLQIDEGMLMLFYIAFGSLIDQSNPLS